MRYPAKTAGLIEMAFGMWSGVGHSNHVLDCISLPNFVEIGQSVAEILQFFDFARWRLSAFLDLRQV